MHLIDIQRVILRYITVTYRDNNQVIWNKKKCPVCMNFNCMPFSSAFEAVLQDSNRAVFCVKFESGKSSESGYRSLFLYPTTRNEMKPTSRKKLMLKNIFFII